MEIDTDPNLTEEEKAEARKEIRAQQRQDLKEARAAEGKTGKGGRKALKRGKKKLEKKIESGLSEEEKAKVLTRLEKLEGRLDKQYSKGKIKEENYTKRKAEIADLRSKV